MPPCNALQIWPERSGQKIQTRSFSVQKYPAGGQAKGRGGREAPLFLAALPAHNNVKRTSPFRLNFPTERAIATTRQRESLMEKALPEPVAGTTPLSRSRHLG